MLEEVFVRVAGTDPVVQGLVAGVVIALFNTAGALVVVFWRPPTERALDAALGFAAGVMLSASFTSLLLPGTEFASQPGYDALALGPVALRGVVPVLLGFAAGGMLFVISHEIVPQTHARGHEHVATMGLMVGLAVMLTLNVVLA